MSDRSAPARVGVRELRQNLSIYLDRVKEGETLEVTEHGYPVARLGPLPETPLSGLDRLIAERRATPASAGLADALSLPPVELPPGSTRLSDVLSELRDEERW